METAHLREFLALAENLNYSETARRLYITQSALSRHIVSLEEELGCRLLTRDRHHVELSAEGEQFKADIEIALRYFDKAVSNVRLLLEKGKVPLRIGYLFDAIGISIPDFAEWCEHAYPSVGVEFSSVEYAPLMRGLEEGETDAAITMEITGGLSEKYEVVNLYRDKYFFAVGRKHPLATRESVTVAEISALPDWIVPDPAFIRASSAQFARILGDVCALHVKRYYYDLRTLLHDISISSGVSLVAGHHSLSRDGAISYIPIEDIDTSFFVCAVWRRDLPPLLLEVLEKMFDVFGMKQGKMSRRLQTTLDNWRSNPPSL